MNNHKQVRRILSNCPSCHIDIFIASYRHIRSIISTYSQHYIDIFVASYQHVCRIMSACLLPAGKAFSAFRLLQYEFNGAVVASEDIVVYESVAHAFFHPV